MVYKCNEIMQKDPLFCLPADRITKVAEMMANQVNGPVFIIESEESRRLAGILTTRDLALKVLVEKRNPEITRVDEVMTRNVISVHPDDDLEIALNIMIENQLQPVPVIDDDNMIVGIITYSDAVKTMMHTQATTLAISMLTNGSSSQNMGVKQWESY